MVAAKKTVFDQIAEKYHLEPQQAESLTEYDRQLRKNLNSTELAAEMISTGRFELRDGKASSFTKLLTDVIGAAPVVGEILSFLGSLVNRGAKRFEENEEQRFAEKFLAINPELDHAKWCQITKSISAQIIDEKASEIGGLSKKDAQKLADKDSEKIIRSILGRDEKDKKDLDEDSLISELSSVAKGPDSITKPSQSQKFINNFFQRS
jgi:hypothetical protein